MKKNQLTLKFNHISHAAPVETENPESNPFHNSAITKVLEKHRQHKRCISVAVESATGSAEKGKPFFT